MSKVKKIFYGIMSILGFLLFLVSMMPVFVGVINVGVIVPAICGLFVSVYSLLSLKYPMENIPWKRDITPEYEEKIKLALRANAMEESQFRKTLIMGIKSKNIDSYESGIQNYVPGMIMSREKRAIIDRIIWILVAFGVAVTLIAFNILSTGYDKYDGNYKGETVVVLGAKVNGNKPSASLRHRLNKAYDILSENKEAKCIVSGAKGRDEYVSEAQAMKKYLVDKGIEEDRIFMETKAKNTEENIRFSKELSEEKNLGNKFIVISQEYHLFRASKYAKIIGVESRGAAAKTPNSTWFPYWMREIFGLVLQL